jgi:energy-coupling factor transporter ATP-binding protein EcfA2
MTSAAMTNGHVIRTRGLTKRYGDLRAVDGINLAVRAGDVYGFLGANGSGKTTTVRMLLGLVLPTSGEAEVLGMPMPTLANTCCRVLARWSRALPPTHICLAAPTSPCSMPPGRTAVRARSAGIASVSRWSRWASILWIADPSAPIRRACASGSGWRPR